MGIFARVRNWNNRNNGPAKRIAKTNGVGRKALVRHRAKQSRRRIRTR